MKTILLLIFLISSLFFISCKQGYVIKDDGVYFKSWNEGSGNHERRIEGADPKTFETVETDCNLIIGKDEEHVYINAIKIENMDSKSLKYIGNYYFVDNDSAYFFGFYNNLNTCEIIGANPTEIKLYDIYPWAHDDKRIIYGQVITDIGDIKKFNPISENWGKTKDKILYKGRILDSTDFQTFEIINEYNAKDKYHTYEYGEISKK